DLAGAEIDAADVESAIGINVGRAPGRRVGNVDRIQPGNPSIGRASKLAAAEVVSAAAPVLVLEAVPDAARVIDRAPLLVAAFGGRDVSPRHAAIERAPHVVEESLEQTEIEKGPHVIRTQDRV